MSFWTCDIASPLVSSQTPVVMAIVPIWNEQKTFYWKICLSTTFWTTDLATSLDSSPTRVVMAIVPIGNHQKNFLLKNTFFYDILNKWPRKVTCFVTNSRCYGHSSNLESWKNFLLKNMFFHDILNKWHHFLSCFVTNSRSYRHSSNWESSKNLFSEKYVFLCHFEPVTSLRH